MQMRTSRAFLVDCTVVSPMTLTLVASELESDIEDTYLVLNKWAMVKCPIIDGVLLKHLKISLDSLLCGKDRNAETLQAVLKLLRSDDMSLVLNLQ